MMQVYPLKSDIAKQGDSLLDLFSTALSKNHLQLRKNDVVAVSSKIVGLTENRIRKLDKAKPTTEARVLAKRFSLDPFFAQLILEESDKVVGGVERVLLTVKNGDAVANAGIDRKNAPLDSVVLWPKNPDLSAHKLRRRLKKRFGKDVAVVIVDSRVTPMRLGTTGLAIGLSGFRPVEDVRGTKDLSGKPVEITLRAIADGIAATAQLVMGEAAERKPFVIIRGGPVHIVTGESIRRAKLPWKDCLYMSQVIKNN